MRTLTFEQLRGLAGTLGVDPLAAARTALGLRLLDLRAPEAFAARHLPGAVNIPRDELPTRAYELPPRKRPLGLLAEHPAEAHAVALSLTERGWAACHAVADPLERWPGPWERGPGRGHLWEPSALVRRWASALPPGWALDLGAGTGRDAVFLAMRGIPVLAVDRLPDALTRARRLAARHGVKIETACLDLRHTDPPAPPDRPPGAATTPEETGGYAAVVMIRFVARRLLDGIGRHLRPGGLLIIETYRQAAPQPHPRGAIAARELLSAVRPLSILEHLETADAQGTPMLRLVARREIHDDPDHDR